MTVNILGTEYTIEYRKEDPILGDCDGYTDTSTKLIVVEDFTPDAMSKGDLARYSKQVLRHEIIHAFLFESGLDASSFSPNNWAQNEEMVDWFAIQAPKLFAAFKEAECM